MVRGVRAVLLLLASGALLADHTDPCPPCPPDTATCWFKGFTSPDECNYKIDDKKDELRIQRLPSDSRFRLTCPDADDALAPTLESASLPRYRTALAASLVELHGCAPPSAPYASALAGLNLTVQHHLRIARVPEGTLRADHFINLGSLKRLEISANTIRYQKIIVKAKNVNLFNSLSNLIELRLNGVILPFGVRAVENLTSLQTLTLNKCFLKKLQLIKLCNLPNLKSLSVEDPSLVNVSTNLHIPCSMTEVNLRAINMVQPPSFPAARSLTLLQTGIQKLEVCNQLENLTIENGILRALPDDWLARCSRLRRLVLRRMWALSAFGPRTLAGAVTLAELVLNDSNLTHLTSDSFHATPNLRVLDLCNNNLKTLPLELFTGLRLEALNLSHNALGADAARALAGLTSLRDLRLQHNPLGDLCASPNTNVEAPRLPSPLRTLTRLRVLSLAGSGATRLCLDWRRDMRELRTLYLEKNRIHALQWTDLLDWSTNNEVNIKLYSNNLTVVNVTRAQYEDAHLHGRQRHRALVTKTFILGKEHTFRCDCNMYWFAKAVNEDLVPVAFQTLYCAAPRSGRRVPLADFPLDLMVCSTPIGCPTGCTCDWHPHNETTVVDCSNSGLTTLPNVSAVESLLPTSTAKIELRVNNNSISALGELSVRVRVRLAGNPLDCDCACPMLVQHTDQILDLEETRCAGGEPVQRECGGVAAERTGPHAAVWGAGGAALSLLLAGGASLALRRHVRLRLKAFLLARGMCLRWARPCDDDHCKYDAFLSYAHEDADAAQRLLAALEGGVRPLRLCVHHRDWRPGEWIIKQIAESVTESRRTIILLSENFARSQWARAEFREAYAHALHEDAARLIVVVLGDAPPADLDPDIQRYVQNNTYLRWGEPAFWEKLRLAMPPGRPRAPLQQRRRRREQRPKPKQQEQTGSWQPSPAKTKPALRIASTAAPAPRRPPPLRIVPSVHPGPPQPSTPIVKFGHIDFSASLKPGKTVPPPCA